METSNRRTTSGALSCVIPQRCLNRDHCDDPECERAISQCHEIDESVFESMKIEDPTGGKEYSALQILEILDGIDCRLFVVALNPSVPSNQHLVFSLAEALIVNYSIPVFKGILQREPRFFHFYRAMNNGQPDVIFSVTEHDGTLRFYDLSNMEPLHLLSPLVQGKKSTMALFECTRKLDQIFVALLHSDVLSRYQDYIDAFWENNPKKYEHASWTDLETEMLKDGPDSCKRYRWYFDFDRTKENPIKFKTQQIPKHLMYSTNYSFMLFYGIHELTGADEFRFYKAKRGTDDYTVVIEVTNSKGDNQLFDLSNMEP